MKSLAEYSFLENPWSKWRKWPYTRGGFTHGVGLHTGWAYTRGGLIHGLSLHAGEYSIHEVLVLL